MNVLRFLIIGIAAWLCAPTYSQIKVSDWADEVAKYEDPDAATKLKWMREYMLFVEVLPVAKFASGYPQLLEDLNSKQNDSRITALKAIGELGNPAAIPFLVPILRNGSRDSQIYAGLAIEKIVSGRELKRRGTSGSGDIIIGAPLEGELDLKPMRWIVFEMLTSNEPNIQGYAVTMAGYLDLEELKPILEALRASEHPAVTDSIDYAIGVMERSKR